MSDDLSFRSLRGLSRQRWWRTPSGQCGADVTLRQTKALPNPLPGSDTQEILDRIHGPENGTGNCVLEEVPQPTSGQTESPDLIDEPNAKGLAAAVPGLAIAAQDASSTDGFSSRTGVVVSAQKAVTKEHANRLAMRTGSLLEVLVDGVPILFGAVKVLLFCQTHPMPLEKSRCFPQLYGGGVAG